MLYSRSTLSEFLTIECLECKEILTQGNRETVFSFSNVVTRALYTAWSYQDHIKIFLFTAWAKRKNQVYNRLYIILLPNCVYIDISFKLYYRIFFLYFKLFLVNLISEANYLYVISNEIEHLLAFCHSNEWFFKTISLWLIYFLKIL